MTNKKLSDKQYVKILTELTFLRLTIFSMLKRINKLEKKIVNIKYPVS